MNDHATLEATSQANLAETLARLLPTASVLTTTEIGDQQPAGLNVFHAAVPKGYDLKEIQVDLEKYLPAPRHLKAAAELAEADSFIAYVQRHAKAGSSVVWCEFNPQTFTLKFTAVLDEHAPSSPAWRRHTAVYTPAASAEWQTWRNHNGASKAMEQVDFAEFLERNEADIAGREGYPTSADMMKMATNFESTSEKRVRSQVRLQSGAIALEYIDNKEDEATVERMNLFSRFCIGIPVFWAGPGYLIEARLKHRVAQGKAKFHYELIRADRVHEAAAKDLIQKVGAGIGEVPMLMGSCK